jgi:hypothetical protein
MLFIYLRIRINLMISSCIAFYFTWWLANWLSLKSKRKMPSEWKFSSFRAACAASKKQATARKRKEKTLLFI